MATWSNGYPEELTQAVIRSLAEAMKPVVRRLVEAGQPPRHAEEATQAAVRSLAEALQPIVRSLVETAPPATGSLAEATARVLQAGAQPVRAAFLARALNALAHLATDLGEQSLGHAAGASSDYAVLLQALEEPQALAVLGRDDPLAAALVRGLQARMDLLDAEGGTLSVETVARLLGISRQAVDKRRRTGRLLALRTGRRGHAYPAWQFGPAGPLPGLEDVLADLRPHDPWMQAAFFLGGNLYLDGARPLDELRRGNAAAVRRAARAYGEQGAA